MRQIVVMLLVLTCFVCRGYSQKIEVFKDTFEGYAAALLPQDIVPDVGLRWHNYGMGGIIAVSTTFAHEGIKGIYVGRSSTTNPALAGEGSLGSANEVFPGGEPFYFTFCWYQNIAGYDRPSVWADFGSYLGIAGVRVEADNTYHVWDDSVNGYIATGISAATGAWEKIQMILYPGNDLGSGNIQCLYDVYIVRENGDRIQIAYDALSKVRQLAMQGGQYVGNNAQIAFNCEPPTSTASVKPYFDDVLIIKDYIPGCGSPENIPPTGDLNNDCRVDFVDFSILANYWMQ